MTAYIIGFDLNREGANYSSKNAALSTRIKQLGDWAHPLDSTWIVDSRLTAHQIRDDLGRFLDANDELLVVRSGVESAWRGFTQMVSDWLLTRL